MGKFKTGLRVVKPVGRLHWSSMRATFRTKAMAPVASVDYLAALPDWLGLMGNDQIGDCLEAALYHGDQIRTQYAQSACVTQPDTQAPQLYADITGYNGTVQTDNGSDPAQSFAWVEQNGLSRADGSKVSLLATFEIDPRNVQDVMDAMDACGGLMVGIDVPQSLEDDMEATVWDYDPSNAKSVGGHEIFVAKKLSLSANFGLISWGQKNYEMTPAFWENFVNQCTACVFSDWVEATGKTPFGMTAGELVAAMGAITSGQIP